jgi:hypothetical protein
MKEDNPDHYLKILRERTRFLMAFRVIFVKGKCQAFKEEKKGNKCYTNENG